MSLGSTSTDPVPTEAVLPDDVEAGDVVNNISWTTTAADAEAGESKDSPSEEVTSADIFGSPCRNISLKAISAVKTGPFCQEMNLKGSFQVSYNQIKVIPLPSEKVQHKQYQKKRELKVKAAL